MDSSALSDDAISQDTPVATIEAPAAAPNASSRRGFLLSAATLSAGLLLSPSVLARETRKPKAKSAPTPTEAPAAAAAAPAPKPARPERVMLSCTDDLAHTQSVVWRAGKALDKPQAQIAPLSATPSSTKDAITLPAIAQPTFPAQDGSEAHHYAAMFTNLNPGQPYCYRVGDGNTWSEWNVFRTASDKPEPFRFLYFGDIQDNIRAMCSRVMRVAFQRAADARFMVFAGDLVTEGFSDTLWDEFGDATAVLAEMIPCLPTPGNHDTHFNKKLPPPAEPYRANVAYHGHFALPFNGPEGLLQEAYYLDYQGVRMISVNANAIRGENPPAIEQAQLEWLEKVLSNNPNRWTIVTHHQPIYSVSENRDNADLRAALRPLYDKYHVDLVLQGHDHAYGRTHKLAGDQIVDASAPGTVYVVSVAGPKMYDLAPKFKELMACNVGDTQLYQVVDVNNDKLTFDSYAIDGRRIDGFQLTKDASGKSTLVEG